MPGIYDLIKFIRLKATTAKREQRAPAGQPPQESRRSSRQQPYKQKGSVHVAVTKPAKVPSQQTPQPTTSPAPSNRQRGNPSKPPKGSMYPQCKHVCKLCNDNHYAYSCGTFENMSVSQRLDHVRSNSLCQNCLKPGHASTDCRSEYRCRVCRGEHNTMIHPQGTGSTPQHVSGNTNHISTPTDVLHKGKLLMTCQVVVTGPTGKSMLVRALLDSGSTMSLITKKVAKNLSLKRLSTSMTVAALGDVIAEPASPTASVTISSLYRKDWTAEVTAGIAQTITGYLPSSAASSVRELPNSKGRHLADPNFDSPGRIDLLLGEDILSDVHMLEGPRGTARATETVFGWAIRGLYNPDEPDKTQQAAVHLAVKEPEVEPVQSTTDALVRFWKSEEPAKPATTFTPEETRVQDHYNSSHMFIPSVGRYMVSLPKNELDLTLGESRSQALKRFHSNERSLLHKGSCGQFQAVIQEYLDLKHARPVTAQEMETPVKDCYYLPMHGVYKESSSTTKLRVVFDASAQTSTKISLNDTLAVGPTLHPTLDKILLKFRTYKVAITGDISKMYREVLLSLPDRQLHRFLWRPQTDQPIRDYCMDRVTFGVTSSPYLAVRTLQQTATDFGSSSPTASWHVTQSFYVDDLLGGADTVEQAIDLYHSLREMLGKGGFDLKKWRSSSSEVLRAIPETLQEPMPTQELVDMHSASYPKALGVAWDSKADTIATHVQLPSAFVSTKRGILSDIARTFDVLGWISPVILQTKRLIQELWRLKLGWDEEVPGTVKLKHEKWREELPLLQTIKLPRCYQSEEAALTVELHGFCDASEVAFAAVVYIRCTYACSPTTCRLVLSKTKVAPLKTQSIPRLELNGAVLLAEILDTTRETLEIPKDPLLQTIKLPRCYQSEEAALTVELHGFCDASEVAFAAVVYIRCTYACSPTTCRLVLSKTKVAPLKTQSIPRLELNGAVLLAEILDTTRETLEIPKEDVSAWCDSTIVLAWLNRCPREYQTYVANRISKAISLLPPSAWRHVPTLDNPADCASRGLTARELKEHKLWWNGPPWLPIPVPRQPQAAELATAQGEEAKPSACNVTTAIPAEWLEHKYSSYRTLLHVTAWVKSFVQNCLNSIRGQPSTFKKHLSTEDINSAEIFLLKASQARAFPAELAHLRASPPRPISSNSKLLVLHPFMGQDGLLHLGGRLSIPSDQKFPIIVSSKDILIQLLLKYNHVQLGHCGPTLLLSHAGERYHVLGGRGPSARSAPPAERQQPGCRLNSWANSLLQEPHHLLLLKRPESTMLAPSP